MENRVKLNIYKILLAILKNDLSIS